MTAPTYAPVPRDAKVLVAGVVSGNLGDYLERHPRVVWWSGDEVERKPGFPAGTARCFVTKFMRHAAFDKIQVWEKQSNKPTGKSVDNGVNYVPGVHVVDGIGNTGDLKRFVYQSLGEHHPKWHPAPGGVAAPPLTAMGAALVNAARVVTPPTETAAAEVATLAKLRGAEPVPYASLHDFFTDKVEWDSTESGAYQGRRFFDEATALGLTKASKDSFQTITANWIKRNRPGHTAQVAKRDVAVETVLAIRESKPFTPATIPDAPVPVKLKRDTTEQDAKALLALVAEARAKALEVIGTLEIVLEALPGLVAGLEEKEARLERAREALRAI